MNAEQLIDLWLDAEEELRNGNDEKCLEMKELFMKEKENLSDEDKEFVEDYLMSVGG